MKGPRIFASRLASFIVICLTLAALAGGALAGAQSPSPDPSAHVLVVPETPAAEAALGRTDARVIARYEAFSLVEAAGADDERLRRAGADRRDDMRTVRTAAGEIDPASERRSLAGKDAPERDETLALVQFVGPPKDAWLERLRATGAQIVTPQAENGYVVHASGAAVDRLAALVGTDPAVRAVGVLTAADKVEGGDSRTGEYAVSTVAGTAGEETRDEAAQAGAAVGAAATVGALGTQYLSLSADEVAELARDPAVVAIEPYAAPELLDERTAQIVAGNLSPPGFTAPSGPGYLDWLVDDDRIPDDETFDFAIDVTDEGLDDGADPPAHADFFDYGSAMDPDRVAYLNDYTIDPNTQDCGGHGTNVASIAAGYNEGTGTANEDGPGFNYGMGVAPFAEVGMSKIFACDGSFGAPSYSALAAGAYANDARISNNSWGTGDFPSWGDYNAVSREYDQLVRDARPADGGNQELVEVFAAGNDGEGIDGSDNEGYGTIHAEASAKNVIAVGAAEGVRASGTDGCGTPDSGADSARDVVDFSSRGPTDDGRLKPDLVAPGTHVIGARPSHGDYDGGRTCNPVFDGTLYSLISGTSQAAAHVSGAAALVRRWYTSAQGVPPSPALTKALLINAATDLAGGENGKGDSIAGGPNADQGWGRVNVGTVFDSTAREFRDQLPADILDDSGQSRVHSYAVEDPGKPVKVTLVWTDAPGPVNGEAFVNNLDLEVAARGHTYKGNVFDGAFSRTGGAADTRNNVESVYLPAGTLGRLAVTVTGTAITGDGAPSNPGPTDTSDQDFALVVSNAEEQPAPVLVHESTTIAGGDGDAVLEPDEPVDLSAEVRNAGDVEATGLDATLAGGAGLEVDQGSSAYPDLAPGDAGSNSTPFEVGLDDAASCGADVQATLEITTSSPAEGSHAIPLTLPTGAPGPSRTDDAIPLSPLAIPDDNAQGVTSELIVADRGQIKDVDVTLGSPGDPGIQHPWVGDLVVDLVGPDGTTVRLADHPGGPDNGGDDFAGTTFDDDASLNVSEGSAPYAGAFRPQNDQLSRFDGKDRRGTWRLRVRDLFEGEVGHLRRWGVTSRKASCDVDNTPPETVIDVRGTAINSNAARFDFHSPSDLDATFECQLDSNPYEPCSSPKEYGGLPDGAHAFRVRAIDRSDNEDPTHEQHVWTVHTTPPDTAITSGPSGFVASREASFQFSSDQDAQFQCSLDGEQFTDCSTGRTYSGLPDGLHSFQVRARDIAGNLDPSPAAREWTVDTVSPAPVVTVPVSGGTTQDRTPALQGLAGTAPGDASAVQVQVYAGPTLGGRPSESHTAPRDASGVWSATAGSSASLSPGMYTVRAVQADAAGNVGMSAPSTFTVALPVAPSFVVAPDEDRLGDVLAGRLTALAACASACKVSAKLTVSSRAARRLGMRAGARPVSLGSGTKRRSSQGAVAVRVRLRARARAALRHRAVAKATLRVTVSEDGQKLTLVRGIVLRRTAGLRRVVRRGLRLWAVSAEAASLSGRLTLSAREARRLGLKPRKRSKTFELASGRTTAGRKPARLTLKVRRAARRDLARARRVNALLEAVAGARSGAPRTASLRMTMRR